MKKSYRGFCPPFIAIGFVLLFLLIQIFTVVAYAAEGDGVVPGSEIAPPGGSTTIAVGDDTSHNPAEETHPETEDDPVSQPPATEPPTAGEGTVVVVPGEVTEPVVPGGVEGEGLDPTFPEEIGVPEETVTPDPVGKSPSKLDTTGITVTSPTIEQLTAKDADLESLLYPSGLQLPTKYMDLLMFSPINYTTTVTNEVAYFLKTAAPSEGNVYTYAEYSAAETYLAVCRLIKSLDKIDEPVATASAFVTLDSSTTVNWMNNLTNATVSDTSRLVTLISNYKDILESNATGASISQHRQYKDFVADHRGVRYSCGDLGVYREPIVPASSNDNWLSAYVLGLYSWWDYAGISQNLTSAIVEYSHYYDDFAYNGTNFTKGSPYGAVSSVGNQGTPANPTQGETDVSGPTGGTTVVGGVEGTVSGADSTVSGTSTEDNWVSVGEGNAADIPVAAVGSTNTPDTSVLPTGGMGVKEVLSIMALVFVGVAVISLLIIRISRRGGHLF